MCRITYTNDEYHSPPRRPGWFARLFPTVVFYFRFCMIILRASRKAKRSQYDNTEWSRSSLEVLHALEEVGIEVEITGIHHLEQLDTPCVVVGNHMSTLETGVLPVIIQPFRDVTFVVKHSLLTYPVFRHVMRSRNPVAVSQTNPREDLVTVLKEGTKRLKQGISMIVFPQGSRTSSFVPEGFNTIGVKLAHKAGVPIVPLALKTDAWGNGRLIRDFGKIDPTKKVRFAFSEPLWIEGRGTEQQQAAIDFIQRKLAEWKDD